MGRQCPKWDTNILWNLWPEQYEPGHVYSHVTLSLTRVPWCKWHCVLQQSKYKISILTDGYDEQNHFGKRKRKIRILFLYIPTYPFPEVVLMQNYERIFWFQPPHGQDQNNPNQNYRHVHKSIRCPSEIFFVNFEKIYRCKTVKNLMSVSEAENVQQCFYWRNRKLGSL